MRKREKKKRQKSEEREKEGRQEGGGKEGRKRQKKKRDKPYLVHLFIENEYFYLIGWRQRERKRDLKTCRKVLRVFICKFHSQVSSRRTHKVLHFTEPLSPWGAALYAPPACRRCTALVGVTVRGDCYGCASAETD